MRLFIGYSSALYFWLRGSLGLWAAEPCRVSSLSQCAYNVGDVESFLLLREAFGPNPLHIMVDHPGKRRDTPSQKCHVQSGSPPKNCFVAIGHSVFVASPALCFLQAAKTLSFFDLVELGYELCGGYSRTPGVGSGFLQRDNRLITPQSISRLVSSLSFLANSEVAACALKYVLPNSKSPAETDMSVKTVLPIMRGGYGFPPPELNGEVPLTAEAAMIARRRSVYPDAMWRKEKACLEYDSSLHHERAADRTRDSLKRNALGCMGYKVITVTPSQLQSVSEFNGVAKELARYLGRKTRALTQRSQNARFDLNEAIKRRMRDDLKPAEWPYV